MMQPQQQLQLHHQHQHRQRNNKSRIRSPEHCARMKELAQRANEYLELRQYEAQQVNGQRVSISRILPVTPGPKCREVFVGKLPRDLFENELLPFMEQAGPVYKIRLMMDFSGSCRGYGFVEYVKSQFAGQAFQRLNKTRIRPNEPELVVLPSFDNKSLYLGKLPSKITKERLRSELSRLVDGIEEVRLPEAVGNGNNRYAFVNFISHEYATQARRILCPGELKIMDHVIRVDWARPDSPDIDLPKPAEEQRSYQLWPAPVDDLLGHNARRMLAQGPPTFAPDNINKVITISNINPAFADVKVLKRIFELDNHFTITNITPVDIGAVSIEYSTVEQANLMLEALLLIPSCFKKLATNNQNLIARRGLISSEPKVSPFSSNPFSCDLELMIN